MKNIVYLSNFRYGKVYPRLRNAVKWINSNQKSLAVKIKKEKWDMFDYPDYWDMPKKLSYRLTADEVDFLQEESYDFWATYCSEEDFFI